MKMYKIQNHKLLMLTFLVSISACKTDTKLEPINNTIIRKNNRSGNLTEINKTLYIKNNMKGYHINIEKETAKNTDFRKVLYTAKNMQLVLMCLKPHEEIGRETHKFVDQFFRIESGNGKCILNGIEQKVGSGDVLIVPAGAKHNMINTTNNIDLKLYTIYSPPNHEDGIVRATKKDAEHQQEKFEGGTTEQ